MELYHGTDEITAKNISDGSLLIKRELGGGELGMGFYTADNLAMAIIFAKGRYGSSGKVVEFDIDKSEFTNLEMKLIKKRHKVFKVWRRILKLKKRFKYLFHTDVVLAPFATIEICWQYKFESKKAEDFINESNKRLL